MESTSKFTDIFIRRPVLATVISMMILVLGARAYLALPINQYPRTENAVVTVSTTYYGADPDTVAGFITTPLENAIAQANGIDYMTSSSQTSVSTISIYLRLNYDADKALTEISTKVSSVLNQLPPGSQQPVLNIAVGQTIDAMYIGFNSDVLPQNNITDYLVRVVQPRLQAVTGVQTAEILGGQNFALRAWLDPQKLAAYGLTASDVSQALANNDYISGLGNTKGQMVQVSLTASTGLHSLDEFKNLIIKQKNGAIIRLSDVGTVSLGADDYESRVSFDGKKAVYIGIKIAPSANLLKVIDAVKDEFNAMQATTAARHFQPHRLRFDRVRQQLHLRSRAYADRSDFDRYVRRVRLSWLAARLAYSGYRHSAVADRRPLHDALFRLFDQSAYAACACARHRPCGR